MALREVYLPVENAAGDPLAAVTCTAQPVPSKPGRLLFASGRIVPPDPVTAVTDSAGVATWQLYDNKDYTPNALHRLTYERTVATGVTREFYMFVRIPTDAEAAEKGLVAPYNAFDIRVDPKTKFIPGSVPIEGPTGLRGPTGAEGPQSTTPGPRGAQGDPGVGIQGDRGPPGPASTTPGPEGDAGTDAHEPVQVYQVAATPPTSGPTTNVTFDVDTRATSVDAPWTAGPGVPGVGEELYFVVAYVDAGAVGVVTIVPSDWSTVGEAGGQGPIGQRGPQGIPGVGTPGTPGTPGTDGTDGLNAYVQQIALHQDGDRIVQLVHGYLEATGNPPTDVGEYVAKTTT